MAYVDGFVIAVPQANKQQYIEHAERVAPAMKDAGALKLVENWGNDVPDGELTSLPMAVKLQDNETVVFSWIIWPSKEVRDAGWEKLMADPRFNPEDSAMPFDGKRMIFGGFETIIEL